MGEVRVVVFKRYIHRHGKRHGPYYYHNVKDQKGRVKSIYVGKSNPAERKRKRPVLKILYFFFLTVILISLTAGVFFFVQDQSFFAAKAPEIKEAALEVDQLLLKVLIRQEEFISKSLRVMNTGADPLNVEVS